MDLRDVVEDYRWQECLEKYLEFSIERRKAFDVLARMCSRRGYEKTPILELAEGACRDAAKQRRRQYEDRLERKKKQEEAAAKKKREDDRIAEEARRAREAEQARLAQEAANKLEEEEKRKRKLQPNQIHREETKFSKLSEVEKEKYRLKAAQRRLAGAKERENAGAVGEEEEEEEGEEEELALLRILDHLRKFAKKNDGTPEMLYDLLFQSGVYGDFSLVLKGDMELADTNDHELLWTRTREGTMGRAEFAALFTQLAPLAAAQPAALGAAAKVIPGAMQPPP